MRKTKYNRRSYETYEHRYQINIPLHLRKMHVSIGVLIAELVVEKHQPLDSLAYVVAVQFKNINESINQSIPFNIKKYICNFCDISNENIFFSHFFFNSSLFESNKEPCW